MAGRALVYDNWLQGFDFPLQFDYREMPPGLRKQVRLALAVWVYTAHTHTHTLQVAVSTQLHSLYNRATAHDSRTGTLSTCGCVKGPRDLWLCKGP
jgi:hypothetical protein